MNGRRTVELAAAVVAVVLGIGAGRAHAQGDGEFVGKWLWEVTTVFDGPNLADSDTSGPPDPVIAASPIDGPPLAVDGITPRAGGEDGGRDARPTGRPPCRTPALPDARPAGRPPHRTPAPPPRPASTSTKPIQSGALGRCTDFGGAPMMGCVDSPRRRVRRF